MGFGGLGLRQVGSRHLKDNAIVGRVIASDAITSAKIAPDTILAIDIHDDAIGSRELASNALSYADQIKDDLIGSQHLGNDALSYAAQIKNGIIGSSKLDADSIYSVKIAPDAIGSRHIGANAISYVAQIKDDLIGSQHLGANVISYINQIKDDLIGSEHLGNDALSYANQIKDDLVGSEHLGNDALSYADQIKDDLIGSQHLGNDALSYADQIKDDLIGSEHLGNDALSYAAQIKDDVIGSQHIADNAVTRLRIIADAIDGTKIADDAIGSEHIADNAITRTRITVAANNSKKKIGADYICDGTADQVEINQAIADLSETVTGWDNCDSSAASWAAVQGDETLSDDNVDFEEGTGSLKCLGGVNNDPGIKRAGLASLDWSDYNLIRLYFKQDSEYDCWLFFYDSAGNWERYDFNGRTTWHQHSISIGSHPDAASAAALDWTDIVEIRIQVDTDDNAYTFRVDNIQLVDRIGGKVVLLEGDYTIDDKIIGDANTVLAGCGDNSYIFVANGTDVGHTKDGNHIIFEDCDNVAVKDLQINLNGANLGGIADKHGIGFCHVYRGVMLNIKAHNLTLGGNVLSIVHSDAVEVSHCYVENFDDYGIAIARCDNCSAHDNVVIGTSGSELWGIAITGGFNGEYYSYDCSLTNNRVENVSAALHLRKSYRCSIIGNNCYNFQTKGVAISSSHYALVSNNNIDGNNTGWVGIQAYKRTELIDYNCEHVDIIGNVIRRCEKVAANRARGILITDANYSSVVGNSIREIDTSDDGVGIESTNDYVVISSNMMLITHDGIIVSGNSCVTGNQIYNVSGDGITCSGATGRCSFTGNYLRSIAGTAILAAAGDDYCCVGNFLRTETINLNGVSNTTANNET